MGDCSAVFESRIWRVKKPVSKDIKKGKPVSQVLWTRAVKQGEHQSRCIPKVPIVSPSLQGSIKR